MTSSPSHPFVSIIIPAYNEANYIRQCLESVLCQQWPRDRMEVIVVDNGSTDATGTIAKAMLSSNGRGQVLRMLGGTIAAVRNCGWRHSRGAVLAFLDGDSVVEPCWLDVGVELLMSGSDISCIGFAVAPPESSSSWVERTWFPISSSGKHRGTKVVRWLSTFNLILRRDSFEKIGGFDETLVTCEDADLGNRLSVFSRLLFSDQCRVRHLDTVKTVGGFLRKEFWRGQNSLNAWLRSPRKTAGWLVFAVPIAYVFLVLFGLIAALITATQGNNSLLLLAIVALIVLVPFLLSLRAGIRAPLSLVSTSALYTLYLLARGVAIVRVWR